MEPENRKSGLGIMGTFVVGQAENRQQAGLCVDEGRKRQIAVE